MSLAFQEKGRKIIFSGPPGSGKTRKLIDIFNEARKEGREDKVLFLVPDSGAREHIRDIIARHSPADVPRAFSDRGIHSLYSYTKKIGGDPTAGKIHLHALINKWVDGNKINTVKNPVLNTSGGRIALERAISTLRSNGYNSGTFSKLPESVIGQNSVLLTGLKLWEEWLSETGKFDERDVLEKAVENADAEKWDTILIDGFTEINPLQWKVMERLIQTVENVAVALDPKQIPSKDLYNKFIHLGFKEDGLDAGLRWKNSNDLRWLADVESWDIHSSKPDSCQKNQDENRIKIIKAGNPRIEASQLAREVTRCIADGYEYKDIAILTPSLGKIHRVLKSEFSRAGIPIRFYLTIPLSETGPGNFVRQLLEIVGGNWDDRAVCSLLSNPVSGIPHEDSSRANYVTGTKWRLGSMDAWLAWADKNAGKPTREFLHKLAELSNKKEIDPVEFTGEIIRVAGDKIRASWKEFPDDLIQDEGWALRAVESCLAGSSSAYRDIHRVSSKDKLIGFLKTELSLAKGKPLDRRSECVNAVTLLGSRTWGIKVALVCGLSRNNFPKKPVKNTFLPDELRKNLDPPMPSYDELKDREEALFRIAVTRASDRITLSWPSTDSSGSPNLPSGPIEKLVEWILNGEEPKTIEHDPPGDVNKCVFVRDLASLALENKIDDPELIKSVSADLGIPLADAVNSEKYESVTIEDKEFLSRSATGSKDKPVSPTDLNHLSQCPYRFFAKRVLGLSDPNRDRVRKGFDFMHWGNIAHDALSEWFRGGKKDDFEPLVRKAFNKQRELTGNSVTEARIGQIVDALNRFAKFERDHWPDGFTQIESELVFDTPEKRDRRHKGKGYDPVEFKIDEDVTIFLSGRVDRVDAGEGNVAIVSDYKRSFKVDKYLRKGLDFQLACYIELVKAGLGIDVAMACYLPIKNITAKGVGSVIFDPETDLNLDNSIFKTRDELLLDTHLGIVRENIAGLVGKLGGGKIDPIPTDHDKCGRKCDYHDLCRFKFSGDEGQSGDGGSDG